MNSELLQMLEVVRVQTESALAGGAEEMFFPTLTLITEKTHSIHVALLEGATSSEMLEAMEAFGYKTGRRKHPPEQVFFAAESIDKGGHDQVMITGCSKEFEMVIGYLSLERNEDGHLLLGAWSGGREIPMVAAERVPAYRAMRGALARAKAPWWRF
jgi:hypothetical protein